MREVNVPFASSVLLRVPRFSSTYDNLPWPQPSFQSFLFSPRSKAQLEAHPRPKPCLIACLIHSEVGPGLCPFSSLPQFPGVALELNATFLPRFPFLPLVP
jgi:hypothetical protein